MTRSSTQSMLLDVAERLAAQGQPLTPSRLAQEAGVSTATVRRHLGGIKEILRAIEEERGLVIEDRRRETSRERLLDAVNRLVRSGEIVDLSLEGIAKTAGVGVATLYRLFGDRRGLLRAFAAERSPRRFNASLDPSAPLQPQLERITAHGLRFWLEYRGLVRIYFSGDDALREIFAEIMADSGSTRLAIAQLLKAHIAAGHLPPMDVHTKVSALVGAVAGLASLCPEDAAKNPEAMAQDLVHTLLHGWLPQEKQS